jgi:uncharacterized protein (UPF0276 family)
MWPGMTAGCQPQVGLSLMLEADFVRAAQPLFAAGAVEVLEWSFDVGWPPAVVPAWANDLLQCYSATGNLLGHGVSFSPLSAGADDLQQTWLELLTTELARRRYRHISEHFGFSSARNFHQSAPLPVPLTEAILRLGQERLRRLASVAGAGMPIGLENLAFAFSRRDVEDQGRFLAALLEPIDGFLLLDLHNLYCQAVNFGIGIDELLAGYPLERVREVHVSGGSWSGDIRRDTHDGPVPEELFAWLPRVLAQCPRVEAVIFERMGGTLAEADDEPFRRDFLRLAEVVHAAR